jgi:hypothetical protein
MSSEIKINSEQSSVEIERPLTLEDYCNSGWKESIQGARSKNCHDYGDIILSQLEPLEKSGDKIKYHVYLNLFRLAYLHLNSKDHNEPIWRLDLLKDLPYLDLNTIREFVPFVDDAELRARLSDIVWIKLRDPKCAEIAIESYLESAAILEDPKHWQYGFFRIERAFRLSVTIGKSKGKFDQVVDHIERILDKYHGEENTIFYEKLMLLLCEHKCGDTIKYASLSEKLALKAEEENDWQRAQIYWRRKSEWHRIGKNEGERKLALVKEAETYVKLANMSIAGEQGRFLVATTHLIKGIETYKRIGGYKNRIDELHVLLNEYQKKSLNEFGVIRTPGIDLTKAIEEAQNSVKGKTLYDAIVELSLSLRIESKDALKKSVIASAQKYPLAHMMGGSIVNEKGKTVAKKPGISLDGNQDEDEVLRPRMFEELRIGYSLDVQGQIDPMRRQISLEHYVAMDDLAPILVNNPLIPEYREYLFAKGIIAGLQNDFVTAIHILVPQLENSFRYILEQNGIPTSRIEDGIEQEYDLNKLLYMDFFREVFGEDLIFTLQYLLVAKEGANIRNRMAHGLMYHGDFHSPDCIHLWAQILRLCCLPSIVNQYGSESAS